MRDLSIGPLKIFKVSWRRLLVLALLALLVALLLILGLPEHARGA